VSGDGRQARRNGRACTPSGVAFDAGRDPPPGITLVSFRMALTFRTDPDVDRALDELTQLEGLSKQEILRRAILERADKARQAAAFQAAADKAIDRWSEVLDRLAKQ